MSALLTLQAVEVAIGARAVVTDANLSVAPGEIVALLGANGAGKSSLLRASVGVIEAKAGRINLGADEIVSLSARERARRIAYLPQAPEAAWPVTVEALVALGRFAYGATPDKLAPADQAAVDHALTLVKLEAMRKRSIDTLSGGERARAHLARAMAQGAPLLALDEPIAELDPAHALAVLDAMRAHVETGGAVLFTTHDVAFAARAASKAYVMREGRIIASGPPRQTLTEDVLRSAYGRSGRIDDIDGAPAAVFF
jgi:iron complex transport system ATP-binding protein